MPKSPNKNNNNNITIRNVNRRSKLPVTRYRLDVTREARNFCNEQSPSGEFFEIVNWTGACNMSLGINNWTNRWSTGQNGLMVMRWNFWLMVYEFATSCVQQAQCSQQDFPGQCPTAIDAASTGYLLSAMLPLVTVRGPDGTGSQKQNDRLLKPVLRLQVTVAHGRITASPPPLLAAIVP